MECRICDSPVTPHLSKRSENNDKIYTIYRCQRCGLWQVLPLPSEKELEGLYEENYFDQRTERGYDNYLGDAVRRSVTNTLEKNLNGLGFYNWETTLDKHPKALEIGSAGGIFVEYLDQRGWDSEGIDISRYMVEQAKHRGLKMIHGDFLTTPFKKESYDLIAMWATLEHLREPEKFIQKISEILKPGGKLFLSTANTGFWARIYKERWRYLNLPEHLYYFNINNLRILCQRYKIDIETSFTYGSGFTSKQGMGGGYRLAKYFADRCARYFHTGDMIVTGGSKITAQGL